jgi:hypothetical protein
VNDDAGADLSLLHFRLYQVESRYSRGIDRRNWDLVKSAFHADAVIDDGLTTGSGASFIDGMARRSIAITELMHLNGNSLVLGCTTDHQQVWVETPCVAWSPRPLRRKQSRIVLRFEATASRFIQCASKDNREPLSRSLGRAGR